MRWQTETLRTSWSCITNLWSRACRWCSVGLESTCCSSTWCLCLWYHLQPENPFSFHDHKELVLSSCEVFQRLTSYYILFPFSVFPLKYFFTLNAFSNNSGVFSSCNLMKAISHPLVLQWPFACSRCTPWSLQEEIQRKSLLCDGRHAERNQKPSNHESAANWSVINSAASHEAFCSPPGGICEMEPHKYQSIYGRNGCHGNWVIVCKIQGGFGKGMERSDSPQQLIPLY